MPEKGRIKVVKLPLGPLLDRIDFRIPLETNGPEIPRDNCSLSSSLSCVPVQADERAGTASGLARTMQKGAKFTQIFDVLETSLYLGFSTSEVSIKAAAVFLGCM